MIAVKQAIVAILQNDATLQTLLGGSVSDKKVYPVLANQFENFPCIVYEEVDAPFRTVPKNVQDVLMQFRIYSKVDMEAVEDIYTRLNFLLNYYTDVVNPIVYMRQSLATDSSESDRQLFGKTVRFMIWTHNT